MPRHWLRLLLAGLAAGWMADVLFYDKLPGISALLFSGLLLALSALALRWAQERSEPRNLWLAAGLLFFSAMMALRANGFLLALDIIAALAMLALLALYLTRRPVHELGIAAHLAAPLQAVALSLARVGLIVDTRRREDGRRLSSGGRRVALPVIRGLLLAAPILFILTALLASADAIFADLLGKLLSLDFLANLGEWIWRGALIVVIGLLIAGGLAQLVWHQAAGEGAKKAPATDLVPRFIGAPESLVALNAINLLFLLFVLIQIPYLFGGQLNVSPEGFTYAEYARRGFAELVLVAMLVLGLLVGLDAVTRREVRRQRLAFAASSTAMVVLTTVMLASAFKRLLLYEAAYGFTRLRVYPHVFMVWLGLLLLWFVVTRWWRSDRFAIGMVAAVLGFVVTLNLLNPDALIVRLNFDRWQSANSMAPSARSSAEPIDLAAMAALSEDAVPALLARIDLLDDAGRAELDAYLLARGQAMAHNPAWQRWPAFNLARVRAYQALAERYGKQALAAPRR